MKYFSGANEWKCTDWEDILFMDGWWWHVSEAMACVKMADKCTVAIPPAGTRLHLATNLSHACTKKTLSHNLNLNVLSSSQHWCLCCFHHGSIRAWRLPMFPVHYEDGCDFPDVSLHSLVNGAWMVPVRVASFQGWQWLLASSLL